MTDSVTPKSRGAWRDWLAKHHADKAEVWLVFYKRHTGKPSLTYEDAVEEALCFGWIDGVRRKVDEDRYMHRFSPRQPGSRWSALNRTRVARMEAKGLMTPAGRSAVEAARRSGKWDETVEAVDMTMPPEFEERLRQDKQAAQFFDSLAASYRRQFIGWINAARRPDTRQRRLDETMALLRRGEKLGLR